MTLDDRIALLNDKEAVGLLRRFSQAQLKREIPVTLDASVAEQLHQQLNLPTEAVSTVSEGELARAALRLVACDPEHQIGIEALLNYPQGEKFALVESALVVSAVLVALQTHVKYERDSQGKWTVKIEKKPTDPGLLKDLIKKLLSFG